ncbi:MBL fold metallo-hydrolase [Ktedonosporobacter rubrisoli]|uniref:MBL fold metallo-hydrolase n=1 Tax=Ktedonosporobacter rubrisoli TaxID=2509675 RepID=A0A4P6JHR7_KTERU|nr:MBL fold metallo-hydrolase [Ktedonosporobacter rubrisoli]QBD74574.1 MBL fold metallo-hydrolase [Ktedonosporobacter rubrisoli]
MKVHLLRHATSIINYHGLQFLVDPMLSPAGAIEPVANSGNTLRNPLVDLPVSAEELRKLLQNIDAVLVTHTHLDHWDAQAGALLSKDLPIFCQPEDQEAFARAGFTKIRPVIDHVEWQGVLISRTGGQHGTGEIGKKMGQVSGFVLSAEQEPTLYIAGDTIWCAEVKQALQEFRPEVVVLNTGAATFVVGDPITMTADDVFQVCRTLPAAKVVAVHLEAINHCRLKRSELKEQVEQEGLIQQVAIPADGEVLTYAL